LYKTILTNNSLQYERQHYKMYESREVAVECGHPRCIPLHKHHILKKYVAVLEENLKYQRQKGLPKLSDLDSS
jgi:hypothetical protein